MPSLFISPTGSGTMDGSSWENAGKLGDLPAFIEEAGPGGLILLRADQGAYEVSGPILISAGGQTGLPVIIRGSDGAGNPMQAEISGSRTSPYDPAGSPGEEVFRLLEGANNLVFQHLGFTDIGPGAFRVGADISNLTIEHMQATNVERFLENYASGTHASATISGLTVRDVRVDGFSRSVIRLQYDTNNVLIEDVIGDSQRQDFGGFAMGVQLHGTAHDVVLRRVTMRNSHDSTTTYWNGDGFATERGNYNIRFEDTVASGSTDAGYDIKSASTVLSGAISHGNKENFRIWSSDAVLENVVSLDPLKRGGTGVEAHFWFSKNSAATINGAHIAGSRQSSITFDLGEGGVSLAVSGLTVSRHPNSAFVRSGTGSTFTLNDIDEGSPADYANGEIHQAGDGGDFVFGLSDDDRIHGGAGSDTLQGGGGHDRLEGGAESDLLIGGEGDDWLTGGAGADVMIGGSGLDVADYSGSAGPVVVDLAGNPAGGDAEGDRLEEIEGVAGSDFGDRLAGDLSANLLLGGGGDDLLLGRDGDDRLAGGAGADRLDGGAGIDTADYSASGDAVAINLHTGEAQGGDAEGDQLSDVENLIGSEFDDILTGDANKNMFAGGLGADVLDGGEGIDTADYRSSSDAIIIDLASGLSLGGDAGGDRLSGIEVILGSASSDWISGDDGANVFAGGEGSDQLRGNGGDDRLIGGADADELIGGSGHDLVDYSEAGIGVTVDLGLGMAAGGEASGDVLAEVEAVLGTRFADVLVGDHADNRLEGSFGDDRLTGGAGADRLVGDEGMDTADYSSSLEAVSIDLEHGIHEGGDAAGDELEGIEIVVGSAHGDSLRGGAGNDLLVGGSGADHIAGGAGLDSAIYSSSQEAVFIDLLTGVNEGGDAEGDTLHDIERIVGSMLADRIRGSDSEEILIGGGGADELIGGAGRDVANYASSSRAVSIDLAARRGTGGDAEGDILSEIEDVVGTQFADTIVGDDYDNRLVGGAGADLMRGGAGIDTVDYSDSKAAVKVSVAAWLQSGGDAQGDRLAAIENIRGSAFSDALSGDAAANRIEGGDGHDTMDGGAGSDELAGGSGNDNYVVDSASDLVREELHSGLDTVSTAIAEYQLSDNVENLTFTGAGAFTGIGNGLANTFKGGGGRDTFTGGGGNDTFFSSAGADTYAGGEGYDYARYTGSGTGIAIDLKTGTGSGGAAEGDTLTGIEGIIGSEYGDILAGDELGNVLSSRGGNDALAGREGNDQLDGGAGADQLTGGVGDDIYWVDALGDVVVEQAGEGIDTVRTTLSYLELAANVENLIGTGTVTSFTGIGNGIGNWITGGAVRDTLNGGGGDDVLEGNAGGDTLIGGAGADTAAYSASSAAVNVNLLTGATRGGHAQGDRLEGIENLIGSAFADILIGTNSGSVLDGGAGADTLKGGRGNDIYVVDDSGDRVFELRDQGFDTVRSSVSFSLAGQYIEQLLLTGSAIAGTGNGLANTITGNGAGNVLNGGAGADTLLGGAGDDIYVVDNVRDRVRESAGQGIDTIQSSVNFSLAGQDVEKLLLVGSSKISGTGNALANTITGNIGANRLSGGLGEDLLIGGRGADQFLFDTALSATTNCDRIGDFVVADDTILLDRTVFTEIPIDGTLAPSAFHRGSMAHDAATRIIYDDATGDIFYDVDGTGDAAMVLFAHVAPGTLLTNADFVAIA